MKTTNLAKALQRFDIRAAEYKKPPVHRDIFALTILPRHKEGVVTVNHGQAKVEVFGDKTKRQASVTVKESGRSVTKKVRGQLFLEDEPTEGNMESVLRSNFPVIMPAGAKWSVADVTIKNPRKPGTKGPRMWNFTGLVTAKVEFNTTNHFLIGMDETHHFIAPLSKQATSVAEAHRLLRPKGLSKGTRRQGEWFFVPATKAAKRDINRAIRSNPRLVKQMVLERTTHTAQTSVQTAHGLYARGYIIDGRTGHHKPFFLRSWHQVVRNKEVQIKVSPEQQAMAARRQRTWD